MYPVRGEIFSQHALKWLTKAQLTSIKEASQAARALCMWGYTADGPLAWLQHAKTGNHWEGDNPVRNSARACTALKECGIPCSDSLDWLEGMQCDNGSWNNDVYDTCYCLMALGQAGKRNQAGVQWLRDNFSEGWMHPGTVALVNTALIYQYSEEYSEGLADTIGRNSSWLLAQRTDDNWRYTATSCLVVQSLILDGWSGQVEGAVEWLVDRVEKEGDAGWKVSVVALVLITVRMIDKDLYPQHKTGVANYS